MRMRKNRKEEKIFPKHSIRARPGQTSPGSIWAGQGIACDEIESKGVEWETGLSGEIREKGEE